MNKSAEIRTDDIRMRPKRSEVERLWADNKKAKKILGWQPNYAGLEGFKLGLEKTISWFSKSENQLKYKTGHYTI